MTWGHLHSFLTFSADARAIVAFQWTIDTIDFSINGQSLEPFSKNSPAFVVVSQPLPADPLSINHPDAQSACRDNIGWRKQRFPQSQKPQSNRRMKSDAEQVEDLRRALASLRAILDRMRAGDLFLAGHLVTEIRALIYWYKDKDWAYNPLLLRMASKAELPLPVYAFADETWPTNLPIPDIHLLGNPPTIVKVSPNQDLMDLQLWMSKTAVRLNDTTGTETGRQMTNADFISEVANTLGCAHYDEDTSEFSDEMLKTGMDSALFYRYLVEIGGVVSDLSEWVLLKLQ